MIHLILNHEHLSSALGEALAGCRRRLFISTADVKNLYVPNQGWHGGRCATAALFAAVGVPVPHGCKQRSRGTTVASAESIVDVFAELSSRGIEVQLLHSGVPSGPFLGRLKGGKPPGLTMRRCPRVHAKAVIADGRRMYLGSANLTGAGLVAKSARRRNFEAGIWTDELALIDPVLDMLQSIWDGSRCSSCGRKDHCPVPLEEPKL